MAPDATVEAIWDPAARFCLGVQWHPEVLTHRAEQAPLVRALVDAARPAARSRSPPDRCAVCQSQRAVLTDYHVHLRPDEPGTHARRGTSPRATPSATARPPRSTGSPSWASPSTSTASPPRWRSGSTRSGASGRSDDLDEYCGFVREETDLRLGIEADFVPGPRGPDREPARGARLGLRRRLGALPARPLARHRGLLDLGHAASRPRRSGGATSRRSRSRRSPGSTTSSPTPTSSRSGASARRGRTRTCATSTSPPSRRSRRRGSRSRSPPRGCASRSGSSTRRGRTWR